MAIDKTSSSIPPSSQPSLLPSLSAFAQIPPSHPVLNLLPIRRVHRFGWRRDHHDSRDHKMAAPRVTGLPSLADLAVSQYMPPVYDQGQLGSCTANAIASAVDFERRLQGLPLIFPSRLFIYYNERVMEGTVASDAGAEIRDGIKSVVSTGVCPETDWAYVESKFADIPTTNCYTDAVPHKALGYSLVAQQAYQIKYTLAILGRPIVCGIECFDGIDSDQTAASGVVPMPSQDEIDNGSIGGHAIKLVGYNEQKQLFKFKNSWSTSWGDQGYGYLPYAYVLDSNLASDFWVITKES